MEPRGQVACRVYKRRWLMLTLFVLCSLSNALQWIQYAIISNIVMPYYNVDSNAVNWTSMIYMVLYIPLIFPASWLLDKMGLRVYITAGALGTALGAWIKVLSVARDRFWVGFLGQSVVGFSQIFILSVPARLAAVWFGPDQVSFACSLGVFGSQLGVALGFLVPAMMVKEHPNIEDAGPEFSIMFYSIAGFTTALFILIVAPPPMPPSPAQAVQRDNAETDGFSASMKRLMTNPGFDLLLLAYGINVGAFYAISTLLNQVVLSYFPGQGEDVGRLGLVMVLAGMLGSVVCGYLLDKTHKFKEVTLAIYALSFVGLIIYTFTLGSGHIGVVYFTTALLGFFMTGYLPVGFELAAEITYPEPEGTSAGLLNAAAQVFGITFTMAYSWVLDIAGDLWANGALSVTLLIGTVFTGLIKSDLRRQSAQKQHLAPVVLPPEKEP